MFMLTQGTVSAKIGCRISINFRVKLRDTIRVIMVREEEMYSPFFPLSSSLT